MNLYMRWIWAGLIGCVAVLSATTTEGAIAYDAFTDNCVSTSTITCSHTPVGTPRGVVVYIGTGAGADQVTGVTYGGVAMTEVSGSPVINATIGQTWHAYFLGSQIPIGTQNAVVSVNGSANKRVAVVTFTAAQNTQVTGTNVSISSASVANPSSTLTIGGIASVVTMAFQSGQDDPANITPLSGWTSLLEVDAGAQSRGFYRYDTVGTADVTIGWTQTADEALAIAVGVGETSTATNAITVCASGCTYTNSQLQTALNSATCGVSVLLQEGFTYTGNFELPYHGCTSHIVLRTGVTAAGSVLATNPGNFPTSGTRMTPSLAATANLAKFQSVVANASALRTVTPSTTTPPAYWHLKWLELLWNNSTSFGSGAILQLGSDTSADQPSVAAQPHHFIVEQIYLHGHPQKGQFRGVGLHASDVTLKDSYLSEIYATSEGQVLWINSTTGNLTITNNYFDGGAETIMAGGSGGSMRGIATVSAVDSRTTTAAVFSNVTELHVGQGMTLTVAGAEQYTEVASCGTSTPGAVCTSTSVTWSPALSAAPDAPGDVNWGVTPTNVNIENNRLGRPANWPDTPIMATPTGVGAVGSTIGGTLAAGTYCYRVTARLRVATSNGPQTAYSTAAAEQCGQVTGSTGSVTISWNTVTNAETYYIYGRTTGAQNIRWAVTAPVTSFVDTGAAGTTENVTGAGITWFQKNTLELKNADTVLIEGNIIEQAEADGQSGYCFLLTPANTGHTNDSTHVANITVRYNIIRHCAGAIQLTGRDSSATVQPSGRTKNVSVTNNLIYDIGSQWGSSIYVVQMTAPNISSRTAVYPGGTAAGYLSGPVDVTFNHNTFITQTSLMYLDLSAPETEYADNLTWKNNLAFRGGAYGIFGVSCTQGNDCWTDHTSGTPVWQNNVISDVTCANYPGGCTETLAPSAATLQTYFTNFAGGNYALSGTSPYDNAGDDGLDIGADIATVLSETGGSSSPGSPPAPDIVTTTLAGGQEGVTYSQVVSVSNGTPPLAFAVSAGTLPDGLSLNTSSGLISGTPTLAGSYSFSIQVTDGDTRTDTQALSIPIAAAPVALNITTASLPGGTVAQAYAATVAATGGVSPYVWSATNSTQLPPGVLLTETGVLSGIPTTAGTYNFTARVVDAAATEDTQALSIVVASAAPSDCTRTAAAKIGGVSIEAAVFVSATAPTACVRVGDRWESTATNPPVTYKATTPSPAPTWVIANPAGQRHGLLDSSVHTGVTDGTPTAGTILVGLSDGTWGVLTPANGYLRKTDAGIEWAELPASSGSGIPVSLTYKADNSNSSTTAAGIQGTNVEEIDSSGSYRLVADLTNATEMSVSVRMSGAGGATSQAVVQYATNIGTPSWTSTSILVALPGSTTSANGAWVAIPAAMKGPVVLRVVITNGNGTEAPTFRSIRMLAR